MIINSKRKNCKDVFNAFLVSYATYVGDYEIPCIRASYDIPKKLVPFSKALSCKDCEQWVHFYEDDYLFERIWKSPERYLDILKKYKGVILPDFSLYRDMPLAMQIWNIYRSRALGNWFQINGIGLFLISGLGIDEHLIFVVKEYLNKLSLQSVLMVT